MRKYYYITIIATIAIICFQAGYMIRLHDNYITEKKSEIEGYVKKIIVEELNIRTHDKLKHERYMYYNRISDMTPEDRDSILHPSSEDDVLINLSTAKDSLLGETLDDIFKQLEQDHAMKNGLHLNLTLLDSLFNRYTNYKYPHIFVTYNSEKISVDSIGEKGKRKFNHSSPLYPIGTKYQLFLQIKTLIPMSEFIEFQFQVIAMSAFLMFIIMTCLLYQLIGIRRKDILLQKRETSVNGTIHDLKTPLNSIITMLSWFRMVDKNSKMNEAIETCSTSVKHMVYNIESLLLIAYEERRKIVLNLQEINILNLTQRVKKELDFVFYDKIHTIDIIDELYGNKIIYADSMYLENVIRNLIENSLKYSDDEVLIEIKLSISDNFFNFTINDTGWGIAPKFQKKIFTQFYRVPRTKDKIQKGYGIGLAHAKNIINAHGGQITVMSDGNQGSTFTFSISLLK